MMYRLSDAHEQYFWQLVQQVTRHSRLKESTQYIQHGCTSVFQHSVAVAYVSCALAERFHLRVDWHSLIRGALLHDYFLYDWHVKDKSHSLHGFHHPAAALRNAQQDFNLSPREKNIILRHMFPLTPVPPMYREGWLICVADKLCSIRETVHRAG